ncbi:Myotubularin-related protein 7 [Merluccius polli]|uniref:Myotubularin-related protein 7 n=1 Tax=Merluccius polli TaxID=89951 RepID=A0AA47MPX6_MERPO|nr:Myotubularin-related protein 7 [Merluccius polli]
MDAYSLGILDVKPSSTSQLGVNTVNHYTTAVLLLLAVCERRTPSVGDFLEALESSGWLKHIKAVLDAGVFVAKAISEEGASVLVHCSDGWDRTAQVCSVACVLLEPYYRTLKGLMVLIEREWVSFGHKFSHRCNHLDGDSKEVSPVMDQFLECVWQLTEQFPCAFEYNERFLLAIHHHTYACQYGNFVGNNQRERLELGLQDKTLSLWKHLWENRCDYINPLYRTDNCQSQGVLRPSTAPYCFKFWSGLYNRFDRGIHPRQSVEDYLMAVREETLQLEEQLASHKEQIEKLENQRGWSGAVDEGPCLLWAPAAAGFMALANTPEDYTRGFIAGSPCQQSSPGDGLIFPPLQNHSEQESGIVDINFNMHLSEEGTREPDPDEAAYSAA